MNTVAVLVLLAVVAGGAVVGTGWYEDFIHNQRNVSWAYRFEYNGEVLNEFDHEIIMPSTTNSITVYLVNITKTDALTISEIDLGCEAWISGFPTLSGPEVKEESGIKYVNVVAGQPIRIAITVTYPHLGAYSNSLSAYDQQTSLLGYMPDPLDPDHQIPVYSYGARIRLYRLE